MCAAALKEPIAVVVCGPSGVGKTTVGTMLAAALGVPFAEGDDYHSEANVAKMRSGTPLTDEDRAPWLQRLRKDVVLRYVCDERRSVVLACSALRKAYRDVLRGAAVTARVDDSAVATTQVFFVLLTGDAELIAKRLSARSGHFMPPSLLASQLAILEPLDEGKECGMVVNLADSPAQMVEAVLNRLLSSDCGR